MTRPTSLPPPSGNARLKAAISASRILAGDEGMRIEGEEEQRLAASGRPKLARLARGAASSAMGSGMCKTGTSMDAAKAARTNSDGAQISWKRCSSGA